MASKNTFFILLPMLLLISFPLLAAYPASAPEIAWKRWEFYDEDEKKFLESRWDHNKILLIVNSLNNKEKLPDFVNSIPSRSVLQRQGPNDLRGISFVRQDLQNVDLSGVYIQGAHIVETDLSNSNLSFAGLTGSRFQIVNLSSVNLTWASLHSVNMSYKYGKDTGLIEVNNLSNAIITGANLAHGMFSWVNFTNADLRRVKMQKAKMTEACLQNAVLDSAKLNDIDLTDADLTYASLAGADLSSSNLTRANFKWARLEGVNLLNANLAGTVFDSTFLYDAKFIDVDNLRYAIWGNKLNPRFVIGEEAVLETVNPQDKRKMSRKAEITYKDLETLHKIEGLDYLASEFRYRRNEVTTYKYSWYHPFRIFRELLLKWTVGYGVRPFRLFWFSLFIISIFTLCFMITNILNHYHIVKSCISKKDVTGATRNIGAKILPLFRACFYFSMLSFTTFGYGAIKPKQWLQLFQIHPIEYEPVRWVRVMVGVEAALGIWSLGLLAWLLFGSQ